VYNFGEGLSVSLNTESSYDGQNDELTVPVNLIFTKAFKNADQAMSLGVCGRYYAIRPEGGPDWGQRAQLTFWFPE
jgi:hypothetical protein